MSIEVNGPSMIITHIEHMERIGEKPDIEFIKELAAVTCRYMSDHENCPDLKWHETREFWLATNPKHSERWGK